MARCPDATKRNSCKSCGVEYFEPADYDDNGGDGDGDGGGDGDSGYDNDMGDELRCQIIIMPAFLHWQACRVKWQTLGKPEARIANRWQASVVAYKMHSCLYTFAGKQRPQVSAFIILN